MYCNNQRITHIHTHIYIYLYGIFCIHGSLIINQNINVSYLKNYKNFVIFRNILWGSYDFLGLPSTRFGIYWTIVIYIGYSNIYWIFIFCRNNRIFFIFLYFSLFTLFYRSYDDSPKIRIEWEPIFIIIKILPMLNNSYTTNVKTLGIRLAWINYT